MNDPSSDHLAALPSLERLLLWTMRAWVLGHCHGRDAETGIRNVFDRLGTPEAVASLDGFMTALSLGARRVLEVNCVCNRTLSDDERALLCAIGFEQEEASEDAFNLLTPLISERAAAAACISARRLAVALQSQGYWLQPATLGGYRLALSRFAAPAGRSARTLH
ncbi:MAG: hypothetical protein P4M00_25000 [Azospirillaceae bacterium]|nr:hypothetical protein [Azospirillaceae bacterium]